MKRSLKIAVVTACLLVPLFQATPASAVPTCPPGAVVIPFPPTLSPDRNGNGAICARTVGQGGMVIFTDDRDV